MRSLVLLLLAVPTVAWADWKPASPAVAAAVKDPAIAEVMKATEEMDRALVTKDVDAFAGRFSADAVVNAPNNAITFAPDARGALASGFIHYRRLSRSLEHAARRANGEVVLMGEETYTPRPPHPLAEKTVRRRFTEVWTNTDAGWRLSLRQATVFEVR